MLGTIVLNKALILLGATIIQKAAIAYAKVLNKSGTTTLSPKVPGLRKARVVIAKKAKRSPPKTAHNVLKRPIFLASFSGVIKSIYIFLINFDYPFQLKT